MADERETQDERDRHEESEEKARGFKVDDRRRFTAEGRARGAADTQPQAQPSGEHRGHGASTEGETADVPRGEAEGPPSELSFTSFVVGIASQAFVFLGVMPDPQSGAVGADLPQAKAMIDILTMLSEKTAGNLDEQESHMMREMLYELRMLYVKELRGGARTGGKS